MISVKLNTVGQLRNQLAGLKDDIPVRLDCEERGEGNGVYVEVMSEDYTPLTPDFVCVLKQHDS